MTGHFWVARKRRYCHLPSKKTNKYCGEHLTQQQKEDITQDTRVRIPCPFDPQQSVIHLFYEKTMSSIALYWYHFKSTVFQDELEQHLKTRCNARPKAAEPWHSLNANCTLPLSKEELEFQQHIHSHKHLKAQPWIARVQLHELPRTELRDLIQKVENLYKEVVPPINTVIYSHPSLAKRRWEWSFNNRAVWPRRWLIKASYRAMVKYTKHADQQVISRLFANESG